MSLETDIAALEAVLSSGASSVFVDGQKVTYDLESIRKRLNELRRQRSAATRPGILNIDLSGF